jgi:hypothetical protein
MNECLRFGQGSTSHRFTETLGAVWAEGGGRPEAVRAWGWFPLPALLVTFQSRD